MAFEAGNLVRLKSSPVPVMTVASVDGDNVRCVWMETVKGQHTKREDTFPAVVLVPHKPSPTSAPARGRRVAISPRF